METTASSGTLVFFGEPAEKMCGAKPVHAAHGYYDGLDAAISFHPHSFPALTNGCFWDTTSAPYWSRIYTLRLRAPGNLAERGGRRHASPMSMRSPARPARSMPSA